MSASFTSPCNVVAFQLNSKLSTASVGVGDVIEVSWNSGR